MIHITPVLIPKPVLVPSTRTDIANLNVYYLCKLVYIYIYEIPKTLYRYMAGKSEKNYYSLTWTCQFPYDRDACYFAHCYPYTYSDLQVGLLILSYKRESRPSSNFISHSHSWCNA